MFDWVKEKLGFDRCRVIRVGAAPVSQEMLEFFLSFDITLFGKASGSVTVRLVIKFINSSIKFIKSF